MKIFNFKESKTSSKKSVPPSNNTMQFISLSIGKRLISSFSGVNYEGVFY